MKNINVDIRTPVGICQQLFIIAKVIQSIKTVQSV